MSQTDTDLDAAARTFAPKIFYLVMWAITLFLGIFGVAVSEPLGFTFWIWLIVSIVALRQIWVTHWITISPDSIRTRNLVGMKAATEWQSVESWSEREIPVRRERVFTLIKVTGTRAGNPQKRLTISIDSDTNDFETARILIHDNLPESAVNVSKHTVSEDSVPEPLD